MEAFRAEAGRHGLRGGLCVPAPAAPGFSTLMLATAQETTDATLQQARPAALLFSRYLHLACMPQIDRFSRERRPRLRAREVECLSWAAMGKTTWEISRLLAISTHTVEYHLRSACERLDAVSRQRAVAKAIELGLLPPGPPAQPSRRAQPARHAPPAAPKPPARAVVHTAVPRG